MASREPSPAGNPKWGTGAAAGGSGAPEGTVQGSALSIRSLDDVSSQGVTVSGVKGWRDGVNAGVSTGGLTSESASAATRLTLGGPSIVGGRMTAGGLAVSRAASAHPRRLESTSGDGAGAGASTLRLAPPEPESPGPDVSPFAVTAFNARMHADLHHLAFEDVTSDTGEGGGSEIYAQPEAEAGTQRPVKSAGTSRWRNSVDSMAYDGVPTGDGSHAGQQGDSLTPIESVWRNVTKSFTAKSVAEQPSVHAAQPAAEPDSAASDGAGAGRSSSFHIKSFRTKSFRSPAVLSGEGQAGDGEVGSLAGLGAVGGDSHGSRMAAAAERAVREADAEAAGAAAAGSVPLPQRESREQGALRKGDSRRLRFNASEEVGSVSPHHVSSPHSSKQTSRSQSFRERVTSALGLGGLFGSAKKGDENPGREDHDLTPLQRVHSVLKKEGTSKQLQLGADSDDDSDGSDDGGAGYRAVKQEGAAAAAAAALGGVPRSLARLMESSKGGRRVGAPSRPDSAVVPAMLHVRDHEPVNPVELEDTLIASTSLLPPGESLQSPFHRPGGLFAKAKLGEGEGGERLVLPGGAVTLPPAPQQPGGLRENHSVTFGGPEEAPPVALTAAAVAFVNAGSAAKEGPATAGRTAPTEWAATAAPKARSTIKLPIITTGHWDSLVFATVWRVGRVFGFQAFNIRPETQYDAKREYVPASIFVAADHLTQLLVKNGYVRRDRGDDADDERFGKALFELHSTIFYSYEMQWAKMQRLSARPQRFTDELRERTFADSHITNGLLSELALYFLIYTESANLRFCSEALWMVFWCMNHSYVMADLWESGSSSRISNARDRMAQLRNTYQHQIREMQTQLSMRPADMRPEDCGKLSVIMSRLSNTDVPMNDRELLSDLVSYGDGGFFTDRMITPIFYVMSYEIDHLSTLGVDTAHRLGYDDFNESLTCRDIVYGALMDLRVSPIDIATGAVNDSYQALSSLGFHGRTYIDNKFDPQVAAEWWRNHVFVKTYRERRSWVGIYRAFFRIYASHFVLFHMMQAQAFAGWNWRIISSAIMTHAWLTWLERVANWMMTMPTMEPLQTTMTKVYDKKGFFKADMAGAHKKAQAVASLAARQNGDRLHQMTSQQAEGGDNFGAAKVSVRQLKAMQPERVMNVEGAPMHGLFGGLLEWLVIAIVLTVMFALQFLETPYRTMARDYWGFVTAGYSGLHLLHFLLTTRDGYAISLTQALNLPEYFNNWSARPEPKCWMYNEMHMSWKNFWVNVSFWVIVLAMKIPFDYFVIHKPVVKPIRLLLQRNWLGCQGPIYRLPGGIHMPCIGGDWILVTVRMLPFVVVALFDTALFYQFVVTAFGIYHGLIKLDLGVISSWEDLVREFHKSPPRWWDRCMSFTGNENQKNLLFSTIGVNAQGASNEEGEEGEGGATQNVAISDGLMFKIKILTPEEIRAKQGALLKERKVNMQAGKQGATNEVEGKGVSAVQKKVQDAVQKHMAATAPGTAANTRPGTGNTVAGARAWPSFAPNGKADAGQSFVAGEAKKEDGAQRMVTNIGGRALVGQDYSDAAPASGPSGFFGKRSSAAGAMPDASGGGTKPIGLINNQRTSATGELPAGGPSNHNPSASGEAAAQAGGVASMFKTLGTAALGAGLARKNQVQPEPVAESREEHRPDQVQDPAAAGSAPPRSGAPPARQGPRRVLPDAWQPEALLGEGCVYDAKLDPLASQPPRGRSSQAASQRLWPWQRRPPSSQPEPAGAGAGSRQPGASGVQLGEIEPFPDDSGGGAPQGGAAAARVYHGALGEGVTLVGPDGQPLPEADDSMEPATPLRPRVTLSEVPVMRADSDLSDHEPMASFPLVDITRGGAGSVTAMSGRDPSVTARKVRLASSVRFQSGKFGGKFGGTEEAAANDEEGDAGTPKSAKHAQPLPPPPVPHNRQRRASFFQQLFGANPNEGIASFEGNDLQGLDSKSGASRSNLFGSKVTIDSSVRGQSFMGGGDKSMRGGDKSMRGGDKSMRGGDKSVRGGDKSMRGGDKSVRGGDKSVRGGDRSIRRMSLGPAAAGFGGGMSDASVRMGSVSALGGIQRTKSTTGGLISRTKSMSVAAGASFDHKHQVIRTKSISVATATGFEKKEHAKWERRHSIAMQAVKHDIATRTASMVLMPEELGNMEEDELDVVSEQMMMWSSFAEAWDAILDDLRDGDLISDTEMRLLKFVRLDSSGKLHGLRPILLPCFFFAGQIRKVVDTGRVNTAQVMVLTEFRVLVTWMACQLGIMSGKHAHVMMTTQLYGGIINVKHILLRKKGFDSAIALIGLIEQAVRSREIPFEISDFADHLLTILHCLESECYAVQKMWELGKLYDDELEDALTLFEVVRDMQERIRKDPEDLKRCLKRAVAMEDLTTNTNVLLQVTTVLRQMLTTTSADATPQGEEAQRILGFFINSLGHPSLDRPESLESMLSWSVLTPAYEEDVLYAVDAGLSAEELGLKKKKITDLLSETDDGFSLMAYLRAMFAFEWGNFKERLRRLVSNEVEIPDWAEVTELDFGPGGLLFEFRTELQLWASYRGQLLARTVRGMMCYERALKVLCRMEYPAPVGITDADYERWVDSMVGCKFEYVVAVQTYGRNATSKDLRLRQLAQGVDILVQRFPSLKVAYMDNATGVERYGPTQFSVLIRNRRAADPIVDPTRPFNKIVEGYRIRLPHNRYSHRGVVLGEGKPENQNHAAVFAFNEGLQAIDMNQDNFLAEALKMRNLLSELHPSNKGAQFMLFADDSPTQVLSPHMTAAELRFVILSRMKRAFPTAIVGFREWIFSANTGALGQYAAATEYAFATIQSRIMTKPARVRMHYGHPDVFNKLHVMTRGGMSKGTRTLHISEDYFIGAAHTLRGGRIRYKEYISCGKGRDMGFDSILGYQKKISGGGADLATSREVHRLGTRLDFFRLMSFYHGGVGHYLNSYLTITAAWLNIWALLMTALAQAMELGIKGDKGEVTLTQTYNVQQVLQLGTLAIIPYVGQLILETGMLKALITVFGQIITGSLFFFIFQQQTVAASFSGVMSYGGMRYIGTGRGFSIQTTDFVNLYTMYSRSHLYLGFEVLFFCATIYALNDCASCNYAALTWNSWLLAFVLILCPLWFNPFAFNLSKVQRDFLSWKRWLSGDMDPGTNSNWYTWNREQLSNWRNDTGNVTDAWRNAAREVVGSCLPYALLCVGMVSRIDFRVKNVAVLNNPYMEFIFATTILWTVALTLAYVGRSLLDSARSKQWRIVRYCITLSCVFLFIVYLAALSRFYTGSGFKHLFRIGYANFIILIMVHKAATFMLTQNNNVREFVDSGFYIIDVLVGFLMFGILAILSFVGFVNLLQSKLLFNEAFSQSVQTARVRQQVKRSGKQIKRKAKPGLLMTLDDWMRSRPGSAAASVAPTVYDGGGVSRAVSMAPSAFTSAVPSGYTSAAPSLGASLAPSAFTSAAPSAFTSAASSRPDSRDGSEQSLTRMVRALVGRAQQIRAPQPAFASQPAAAGGAGVIGGANLDPDGGLRERRLRFE